MPRCVSSMIFPATNFVAGSSSALRCNAQQAAAKAADILDGFGSNVAYLANSYRVLLTRARQGMAIYVPAGSDIDDTRKSDFYEQTPAFLCECGITRMGS
jgi:Uncharacterized conserved protein (DUF2075)